MPDRSCKICGEIFSVPSEKTNKLTCSLKCRRENKKRLVHIRSQIRWKTDSQYRQKKLDAFQKCSKKFDKEKKTELQIKRLRKRKLLLCAELGNKCLDCGILVTERNLIIFDFHHLNPEEKEKNGEWKLKTFDISKVVLLCSNCHRLKHFEYFSVAV